MRLSEHFEHARVVRDGEFVHLDEAEAASPASLVYCQQLDYVLAAANNPYVACIITKPEFAPDVREKGLATAPDPRLAFFRLYRKLFEAGRLRLPMSAGVGQGVRIHPSAVVSALTRIGNGVSIGPQAVVEDYSEIGEGTVIGPGAVIGAEGMLTVREEDGAPLVVPHAGGVTIGRDVLILAGAVVAKSLYRAPTQIGDGSQIGILANVGHGARIGRACVVSSNCVVAGRVRIGDGAWIGVACSIAQGLCIGQGARVHLGSVVVQDVGPNQSVSGNFALPHASHMRSFLKARRP
jgi:UDP-3-O-[3-hydroxymyristoyl] glucosamine N-acyltransferase